MVVCVHIPRFELTVAAGGAEALAGRALALAPMAGAELRVGEVSGAAEAHGVAAGMSLSEALVRCPELELVPADPLAVADAWEAILCALEGIGAAVESSREGLAYFDGDGLRGMHGSDAHTLAAQGACAAGENRGGTDALLRAGGRARGQPAPREGPRSARGASPPRRPTGRAARLSRGDGGSG
jgi:impB/mucB/samB family protein